MWPSPTWLVAAGVFLVGAVAGYAVKDKFADAEIARLEAAHAAEREAQAREAAARFARAQDAEAQAVHALHATRQQLFATQRRLKDALYSLPATGCGLSSAARGLLNGALDASAVPQDSGGADRADAGVATDSGATAERDLALWIADAIRQYEECRARIDAIRKWDEVTYGR